MFDFWVSEYANGEEGNIGLKCVMESLLVSPMMEVPLIRSVNLSVL